MIIRRDERPVPDRDVVRFRRVGGVEQREDAVLRVQGQVRHGVAPLEPEVRFVKGFHSQRPAGARRARVEPGAARRRVLDDAGLDRCSFLEAGHLVAAGLQCYCRAAAQR